MSKQSVIKSGDQSSTSASFADVTGLGLTVRANTRYRFKFVVHYTTGVNDALRLAINGPASPTSLRIGGIIPSSNTTFGSGSQTAYDTTIFASTTAAAVDRMAIVSGVFINGATAGTLTLRMATEATESVTIFDGSHGELEFDDPLKGLTDWPLPMSRAPRAFASLALSAALGSSLVLLSSLSVVSKPAAPLEWANPRAPTFPVALRTWIQSTPLTLLGQDKFYGAAGEPPPNTDWPNPRGPVAPIELRSWQQNLLQSTLAPAAPFYQTEWPNPRAPTYPVALRTFSDPLKLTLAGKDTFFGAAGEVPPNTDWPNPRGPVAPIELRSWQQNLLQSTLAPATAPPFFQTDWPNPRGATYPVGLRTFADVVKLSLLNKDQFFGAAGQGPPNTDWPVPKARAPGIDQRTWLQNSPALLVAIVPVPFSQTDWPNPRGATYSVALRTFSDPFKLTLAGKDTFFGAAGEAPPNTDWPNPRGRVAPIELRSWQQNLLQSTLTPAAPVPFFQTDWPNPAGARYPFELRTFTAALKLTLQSQDKFYGAPGQAPPNTDWPVPKGRTPGIDQRTWLQNLLQGTLAPVPFHQTEWPNPRAPIYSIALRTFVDVVKLSLLGKDTFFGAPGQVAANTNWPVPRGATPAQVAPADPAATLRLLANISSVGYLLDGVHVRVTLRGTLHLEPTVVADATATPTLRATPKLNS